MLNKIGEYLMWVCLISGVVFMVGLMALFGIFVHAIMDLFGLSAKSVLQLVLLSSIFTLVSGITGGWLLDRSQSSVD